MQQPKITLGRKTMFYLYDQNRLRALRMDSEEAIGVARFCEGILVTNRIQEAVLIAHYSKAAFLLHPKNKMSLFSYCRFQWQHKTLKEFRIILYAAPKKWLYFFLKFFALISMGTYRLIPLDQPKKDYSL